MVPAPSHRGDPAAGQVKVRNRVQCQLCAPLSGTPEWALRRLPGVCPEGLVCFSLGGLRGPSWLVGKLRAQAEVQRPGGGSVDLHLVCCCLPRPWVRADPFWPWALPFGTGGERVPVPEPLCSAVSSQPPPPCSQRPSLPLAPQAWAGLLSAHGLCRAGVLVLPDVVAPGQFGPGTPSAPRGGTHEQGAGRAVQWSGSGGRGGGGDTELGGPGTHRLGDPGQGERRGVLGCEGAVAPVWADAGTSGASLGP